MKSQNLRKTVFTALCVSLCVVLPLLCHAIPKVGSILSPMHIPVLLCGLVCGPFFGGVCGLLGPFLSSLITGMPPLGYLPAMLVELCVYGLISGIMMKIVYTKNLRLDLYISLVTAMIIGRIAAGVTQALIFNAGSYTFALFLTSYFVTVWPALLLQLVLLPQVVAALMKARLIESRYKAEPSSFEYYLNEQLRLHPSMQPRDIAKLCFQAANGAEHLLTDLNKAREFFFTEYESVSETDEPLYEYICEDRVRINLGAWKRQGLPPEWLFNIFVSSAVSSGKYLNGLLSIADKWVKRNKTAFDYSEWESFLKTYREENMPPVRHSEIYREKEKPAYRVASGVFVRIVPVLLKANEIDTKEHAGVIAIDGPAASGKSTCGELLSKALDCDVIHLDDFFLPIELRNEERFKTPGNNIHKERFAKEVIPFIRNKEEFSYTRFDCSKMALGEKVTVGKADWRIAEGSYSHHPEFNRYYDISVFSRVNKKTQKERILKRNGTDMAKNFFTRWIPMENEYFKAYRIKEKSDIII